MLTRWLLAVAAAVFFLVVLPILIAFDEVPGLPAEKTPLAQVSYSKAPAGSSLSIALQPPLGEVAPWGNLKFALVFTNSGTTPVILRQLISTGECMELTTPVSSPLPVPPRNSVRLSPEFRAGCESGQFPLTLLFRWEEASGAVYDGFVTTSPIAVLSKSAKEWPRYFKIVSGILKDFSWPILLLVLGAWIQDRVAARDTRLRNERETRDRQLKEEQDARESRNQILNTLLPNFMSLCFPNATTFVDAQAAKRSSHF